VSSTPSDKANDASREVRSSRLDVWEVLREELNWLRDYDRHETPAQIEAKEDRALPEKIKSPTFGEIAQSKTVAESAKRSQTEKLEEVYRDIHKYGQGKEANKPRAALCLSGGGIRSATFGLGLIQGLARCGLLERFDYLSTVSGGGYIGGWLSAWIARDGLKKVINALQSIPVSLSAGERETKHQEREARRKHTPPSESPPKIDPVPKIDPEPHAIEHLRSYSNYLTPRLGFTPDTWSVIATYLRNLLLNWLVLIPLLAAVLLVPRAALLALRWQPAPWEAVVAALVLAAVGAITMMAYTDFHRPSLVQARKEALEEEAKKAEAAEGRSVPLKGKPSRGSSPEDEYHFITRAFLPLIGAVIFATAFGMWARHSPQFICFGRTWLCGEKPWALPVCVWFGFFGVLLVMGGWLVHLFGSKNKGLLEALFLAAVGFVGGCVTWLLYNAIANPAHGYPAILQDGHLRHALYACLAGPLLLVLLFAFSSLLVGLVSGFTDDDDREWWARAGAWVFIIAVAWAGFSALVIFGPYLLLFAAARAPTIVASLGGVSGLVVILVGKSGATTAGKGNANGGKKGPKNIAAEIATSLAAPIFAFFLLTIVALGSTLIVDSCSFQFLRQQYVWHPEAYLKVIEGSSWRSLLIFTGVALAISGIMSFFVNINKFSMHAMYRNRLIRAYLGASRERAGGLFSDFQPADNLDMKDLARPEKEVQRPFHVLSMTLNLTSGSRLSWQNRRAESFTISPLHGGSLWLGYRRVHEYSSMKATELAAFFKFFRRVKPSGGLTLGTAMTISGAAVSPNMGYHSSALVAFLMTLFNARLGWWLGNPGRAGDTTFTYASPKMALRPLISELLGLCDDASPYVMLSDGGHFENLGLYEMVLRRCRLIVLSDAGEDPAYSFEDLSNALTKIHTDLGVPIVFTDQVPISKYDSEKPEADRDKDQLGGKYCALGIIRYSAIDTLDAEGTPAPDGLLIYLKPTLIGKEPADLLHYARSNSAFPHEPTLDEFYSEAQFESYRVLGAHIIEFLCGTEWKPAVDKREDLLQRFAQYAHNHARRSQAEPADKNQETASEIESVLRGLATKKDDTAK
jgi:hypothetical protein